MNKHIEYISFEKGEVIELVFNTDSKVFISSGKGDFLFNDFFSNTETAATVIGKWVIEKIKSRISVREIGLGTNRDTVIFNFESEDNATEIKIGYDEQSVVKFENVIEIKIFGENEQRIQIISRKDLQEQKIFEQTLLGEKERLLSETEKAKKENEELKDIIKKNHDEKENEHQKNIEELKTMADEIDKLKTENVGLKNEAQKAKSEIEQLKKTIEKSESEKEKAEIEHTKLIDRINSEKELLELDCEQADKTLEVLLKNISFEKETAEAMENSSYLKYGTVTKSFEHIESDIEDVKNRLKFIIRTREQYNRTVTEAIVSDTKNGTITEKEELGGDSFAD